MDWIRKIRTPELNRLMEQVNLDTDYSKGLNRLAGLDNPDTGWDKIQTYEVQFQHSYI
jgi:hypothetical protein